MMIHLVCGAEIRTQDLLIITLLLEPLDQGSHKLLTINMIKPSDHEP